MNSKIWLTILIGFVFVTTSAQFKNPKNLNFNWKTDTLKHSVNLSEIQIVLPKGSFPTLDSPKFVGKTKGLTMFFPKEPVIAVEINGEAKAYSLNILTMHEIANDRLGRQPILVTYCPLCNSGIVYSRKLTIGGKQEILEFEPSGMLRNSDMVMLDRKTESLWQQLLGEGIVGKYTNTQLNIIPSLIISVDEFFNRYPKGNIMSKNTGFIASEKQYGKNPYVKYDGKVAPIQYFFDSAKVDKRLPALERIVDIEHNGDYKIYSFTSVAKKKVLNDTFKGTNVVLFYQPGTVSVLDEKDISKSKDVGSVTVFKSKLNKKLLTFKKEKSFIIDTQTNSKWDITGYCFRGKLKGTQLMIEPHSNHFAFAWLAFHPESEIYTD